jgi:hypothetical protein
MSRVVAVVLILLGLWGGVRAAPAGSPRPAGDEATVVRAALHTHTRMSDGLLSPMELVLLAKRRHLDVLAVTEHNTIVAALVARAFSGLVNGPVVLVAEEVTTRDYHLLAYGLHETVTPRLRLRDVLKEVHRQGGVAVAAHPTKRYWAAFEPNLAALDGVEVVHPMAAIPESATSTFRWSDMVAFYERAAVKGTAAIGTSDYHAFGGLDRALTFVAVSRWPADRGERAGLVLSAMRRGDTATRAPSGRVFGAPTPPAPQPALTRPPPAPGETALGMCGLIGVALLLGTGRRRL